jgi:hypothetical protein
MRVGMPGSTLEVRMAFLAERTQGWRVGWATWALCALALLWYLALVSERRPTAGTRLAVVLAGAGVAVDLTCDALYVVVLPEVARAHPDTFLLVERAIGVGSVVVANGLYSIALLITTTAVDAVPWPARALGWASGTGGLAMAVAGLAGSPRAVEACAGATMGLFMAWTVVFARALAAPTPRS